MSDSVERSTIDNMGVNMGVNTGVNMAAIQTDVVTDIVAGTAPAGMADSDNSTENEFDVEDGSNS
jgi:hypothetical protein